MNFSEKYCEECGGSWTDNKTNILYEIKGGVGRKIYVCRDCIKRGKVSLDEAIQREIVDDQEIHVVLEAVDLAIQYTSRGWL